MNIKMPLILLVVSLAGCASTAQLHVTQPKAEKSASYENWRIKNCRAYTDNYGYLLHTDGYVSTQNTLRLELTAPHVMDKDPKIELVGTTPVVIKQYGKGISRAFNIPYNSHTVHDMQQEHVFTMVTVHNSNLDIERTPVFNMTELPAVLKEMAKQQCFAPSRAYQQ